jgi:ribose transport system substrate-binding protein
MSGRRPLATWRLLLVVALVYAVAACGNGASGAGKKTVGFIVAYQGATFADELTLGFRAGVDKVGGVGDVTTGPPIVDGTRQVAMFQKLVKQAGAGVSVETLSPELFDRPLATAVKAGVPIIAVDTPPTATAGVKTYVGNDNYALGQSLADEVVKRLPVGASGTVILGTSAPGVPVLDSRVQGMTDVLKAKRPKVRVLGPFDTSQDIPANLVAWSSLAVANPTALAFLGTGEADAYNLASVRERTHATWLAGAFDLNPKSLTAVKTGQLIAVVSPEHYLKGMVAGRLQAEHALKGTALPSGWIVIPGATVTAANVAQFQQRQASAAAKKAWAQPRADALLKNIESVRRPLASAR